MVPERTPLLLERRGHSRDTTHKAIDHVRALRRRQLIMRELDVPPTLPVAGLTMASPMGLVGLGGIMRHS